MPTVVARCRAALPVSPDEFAANLLDLSRWPEFTGYGPLPGIRAAEFDLLTPDRAGTRIRVRNTDGSTHIEEIVCWELPQRIALEFKELPAPLSRLARRFLETWEFQPNGASTELTRTFRLEAAAFWTWPILWLLARLLRGAAVRHLKQLAQSAATERLSAD